MLAKIKNPVVDDCLEIDPDKAVRSDDAGYAEVEHVAIFDEAQRAWTHERIANYLRRGGGRMAISQGGEFSHVGGGFSHLGSRPARGLRHDSVPHRRRAGNQHRGGWHFRMDKSHQGAFSLMARGYLRQSHGARICRGRNGRNICANSAPYGLPEGPTSLPAFYYSTYCYFKNAIGIIGL